MTTKSPKQIAEEMAERVAVAIVIEMMEYPSMDFNDEEEHLHNRRVNFAKDKILTDLNLEELVADRERLELCMERMHRAAKTLSDLASLANTNAETKRLIRVLAEAINWYNRITIDTAIKQNEKEK